MSSVTMEEYEVMKEAKYRTYVSAVDKALKAFENTNEWHDLISALAKLNKVLKDNHKYPVIPRRIKISKRLAQCMHFALPAGVHLKALETYDTIFKCMGTNRLSHELFIYTAGLFPLFGHSAMNVKPMLLTIYETHFVPLGPRLRPGLSGFLSGVLPGLEEGSDHFERTNSLLEKVCAEVGSEFFYSCLWECVSCNSAIRFPAISFVLSHFNKKLAMDDQRYLMGTDCNIMVNALCAGVQDANILVQRSSLDLLLVGFPLHSNLLDKPLMVNLVTSAITTVLRRDMSLNRRLYSWLLGSDLKISQLDADHPFLKKIESLSEISQTSLYFDMYSKEYLIQGVKSALKQQNIQSPDIRPYRLLISLLDKQDVGPLILEHILYEVFRTLYLSCQSGRFEGVKCKQEIMKSANLLFNSLEPWYIWQYIGSLFDQACKINIEELTTILEIETPSVVVQAVGSGYPNIWEVCELCEFLLEVIPLEPCGGTSSNFMLDLFRHIVIQLTKYIETLSPQQIARSLSLCRIILSKIQPLTVCVRSSKFEEKNSEAQHISAGVIRSRVASDKPENESKPVAVDRPLSVETKPVKNSAEFSRFSTVFKDFLKQFEIFYETLVGNGRIIHSPLVPETFESMKKNPEGKNENEYAKELRKILTAVMNDEDTSEVFLGKKNPTCGLEMGRELAAENNFKWKESFRIASEILVELSSFPKFRVDFSLDENTTFQPWIKFVVVCACCLDKSPEMQLIAIKCLLNLLSLSKLTPSKDGVIGLLNWSHAEFLERNTTILEILGKTLWRHLGGLSSDLQVTCIELLYQLHGIFPLDDSLERVVGEALLRGTENGQVEALRRFVKLWHVGREIQSKDIQQKKLFHKSLLKVLDNLLLPENSPLKIETQTCLIQSLIRGDLPRLLDPILLMLLDPATSRMSILHVSIQHSTVEAEEENKQVEESDNKIYAISSVDGNIIYHVSTSLSEKGTLSKKLKWRWKKSLKQVELSPNVQTVFAVTTVKNRGDSSVNYVTKKNIHRDIELPPTFGENISVFVNPFSKNFPDDIFCSADQRYSNDWNNELNSGGDSEKFTLEKQEKNGDSDLLTRQPKVTLEVTSAETTPGELRFFGQLKNKLLDIGQEEFDDSHSADEYFNQDNKTDSCVSESSFEVVNSVLDSLIESVVRGCEKESADKGSRTGVAVHPYHSHFLLYCGVYDSCRTLYAFTTLKNILVANSRLFLCCAATSGIVNAPFSTDLLTLLARHKKSMFGRNFHGDPKSLIEYMAIYRSNMYLEIFVSICLHFARSYYPNLGVLKLTADEIAGNRQVQLISVEILMLIIRDLIPIVRDSGKGFSNYIADMLIRCKVQKTILYCLMSSLLRIHKQQMSSVEAKSFTEEILEFNDPITDEENRRMGMSEHSTAFQTQLLKVLQALIELEAQIDCQKAEGNEVAIPRKNSLDKGDLDSKYTSDFLIPQQPVFLKEVLTALSLKGKMRFLHYNWTELITSSLPYLGSALPQIVMKTIYQICANIEELAAVYSNKKCEDEDYPPGYAVSHLEALTILCHFCLLDSSQQVSPQPLVSAVGSNPAGIPGSNPAQILSNLVHAFTPSPLTQDSGKCKNQQSESLTTVRANLLANMPRIISSLAVLWETVTEPPGSDADLCIWGNPKLIRNQILEFFSPISLHHGATFLAAIAVTWEERKGPNENRKVLPVASRKQQILVNLVSALRVMPIDTLVQTVHLVVKQPPVTQGASPNFSLDVSILELFYVYMQSSTSAQLGESWNSLLALLRDGLLLAPPALFLALAILNEFVQKCPPFQDKKNQRDLQDITAKLIEAIGAVAGACLEQKTWLGRNLAVKEDLESVEDDSLEGSMSVVQQHSVQAQLVLAHILAPLLDVSYGSQEKDRVASLLTNLMYNITPYLKNHMPKNAPSFAACSQLLANLSGFQYTRKAWKREVFELLLEPNLFQMEVGCLSHWTTIIDNLMTHDVTSFRDLMSKISLAQSGSYTLFSSREQEYEQRSQFLKRLAFVIFCSETDQYHKFMPNIQEKLSEILRLPQVVPSVQAQVFFCFRILLLRMSSHHVISLWPIIISEMVQVFTLIEEELCTDSEEFSSHIKLMSALDSSWVANSNNGLHAHGHPHWLQLILAAAKLLDLAVLLPFHHLPQFQMYRWAFVSDPLKATSDDQASHDFVPHVMRISRLMDSKYGAITPSVDGRSGSLLLEESHIDSLQELHPFFASVGLRMQCSSVDMEALERNILQDFVERMSAKGSHQCDVIQHNKPDDIWVSFLGKVCDLTPLIKEYKNKREAKPLLAYAGKDISHWFDKRTQDIKFMVHPVTGVKVPYCPHGPIPHVHPQVPTSKWQPLLAVKRPFDGLPWWRDQKYVVGYLSSNPRPVRVINSACPQSHRNSLTWVAAEEKMFQILNRLVPQNSHVMSYTMKFEGEELRMDKTLDENEIFDERKRFGQLGMPDNCYVPAIQLYYNDDLTK